MSQAESDSSPEMDVLQPKVDASYADSNDPSSENLQPELVSCERRYEQTRILLLQTQEQLNLAQQVIERQEVLNHSLQERIVQIEKDVQVKSDQLAQANVNCDDLRGRLKRQQHHVSQLKAALERCLESHAATAKVEVAPVEIAPIESWVVDKLSDDKLDRVPQPVEALLQNLAQAVPVERSISLDILQEVPQEAEMPTPSLASLTDPADPYEVVPANYPTSSDEGGYGSGMDLLQDAAPQFIRVAERSLKTGLAAPISCKIDGRKHKVTSLAAVKLPQFPPLQRR